VGASEIITNNMDGFVFRNDNEFVEILKNILMVDLDAMKKRAREKALQFSWINIARSLIGVLKAEIKK